MNETSFTITTRTWGLWFFTGLIFQEATVDRKGDLVISIDIGPRNNLLTNSKSKQLIKDQETTPWQILNVLQTFEAFLLGIHFFTSDNSAGKYSFIHLTSYCCPIRPLFHRFRTCKWHPVVPVPNMALACSCAECPQLQPDAVFVSKSFLKAVK